MTRPWVSPQQVRDYTDIESVKNRSDEKLAFDIARAEEYVIAYTHNDFSDIKYATRLPASVITAIILLSEQYASNATVTATAASQSLKSETFDDYSYTAAEAKVITADSLDLPSLLNAYILDGASGTVNMRLRAL